MGTIEIIRSVTSRPLHRSDGWSTEPAMLPGLSSAQILDLERAIGFRLPEQYRRLLMECRGVTELAHDTIDFSGTRAAVDMSRFFARSLTFLREDGGGSWAVELGDPVDSGPVWFYSVDPPVLVYQAHSIDAFIDDMILGLTRQQYVSALLHVWDVATETVWRDNPDVFSRAEALEFGDDVVRAFAGPLDRDFELIDLRGAEPGDGFSWGRYGPDTEVRYAADASIFAYRASHTPMISKIFPALKKS